MDLMTAHYFQAANGRKPLAFDRTKPFSRQRAAMEEVYTGLLKMPERRTCVPFEIEYERQDNEEYDEVRFKMETEPGFFVPAHLLLPKNREAGRKLPVVICLQGHSTGMHISLGRPIYPNDEKTIAGDRDFALQAVRRGYAAIAMEQRGLGELKTGVPGGQACHQMAMQALLVGHTLLGERVHDVRCLVENLGQFRELDTERVGIMGNSGGGTTSYHAAGVIPGITAVLVSCAFNRYDASILSMYHCDCNYIPGILNYMEMPDLAVLIAPRPLLVVSGREDAIFPLEAAERGFAVVEEIYEAAGAPQNCRMIVGEGGHRFYAEDAWPVFEEML